MRPAASPRPTENGLAAAKPLAPPSTRVLIVDDDPLSRAMVEAVLRKNGYDPVSAASGGEALKLAAAAPEFRLIFLDVMMPDIDGFETFRQLRQRPELRDTPVIFITATDNQSAIHQCFQIGGADYISKPIRESEMLARMRLHLSLQRNRQELLELETEHALLKDRLFSGHVLEPTAFKEILTVSPKMLAIFQYIESIARTSRPVFITGETGTGKELVAKATHRLSGRKGKVVPLNVAGLDDNLFSDTLFGHVKGAFTGAVADRPGLIEEAGGGTLFLDEIGDLDTLSQVKLLRLLQEGEYYPLGADQRKWSDARMVVATHQNIQKMVESGKFRKDLYYRLRTHHVHIPPLRERKCDLPILTNHFVKQAADALQRARPGLPPGLLPLLEGYEFPGNIRELEGIIFDAVSRSAAGNDLAVATFRSILAKNGDEGDSPEAPASTGEVPAAPAPELPAEPPAEPAEAAALDHYLEAGGRFPTLRELTGSLIRKALDRAHGNQAMAAQMLGLTRQALNKRLKRRRPAPAADDPTAGGDTAE